MSHVINGFTAAWSQCFSEALRGLQVVCYGGCLGSGDKAAGRLSQVQQTLPGCAEAASTARQPGTNVSDMLCHRLFSVDKFGKTKLSEQRIPRRTHADSCIYFAKTLCKLFALLGCCEDGDS